MSFSVTWHLEKRVIYLKVFDIVTPEDVINLNQETKSLMNVGIHPVHVIIDTLGVSEYPNNLRWVIRLLQTSCIPPTGWSVLVQTNPAIRVLASTILGILRLPVHTCTTLQEARDFVSTELQASIPTN